jgi:hypothetical protein
VSYPHAMVAGKTVRIREVAMDLARKGLDAEQIREALHDMADDVADEIAVWIEAEDRRTA